MSTIFENALASFSDDERLALEACLARWQKDSTSGPRIVPNLKDQVLLGESDVIQLLRAVLIVHSAKIEDVEGAYVRACHKLVLRGGPVTLVPPPALLGRGVDKYGFVNHLYDEHRHLLGGSKSLIKEFVDKLINDPYFVIPDREGQSLMSPYAAWVTWMEPDGTKNPFSFCKINRGDEVRASLGLASTRKGRSPYLLLLVYPRDAKTELFRPTVADAATYPFFRAVRNPKEHHGWTLPWPEEEMGHALAAADNRQRPEALHRPLPVAALEIPVRCLQ